MDAEAWRVSEVTPSSLRKVFQLSLAYEHDSVIGLYASVAIVRGRQFPWQDGPVSRRGRPGIDVGEDSTTCRDLFSNSLSDPLLNRAHNYFWELYFEVVVVVFITFAGTHHLQ